jgi:hypothetical protein
MANLTITNVDIGSVILQDGEFRDDLLTFGGAGTVVEGTILARRAVANAVVAAADGGNTGNGTVTLSTVAAGPVVPLVGVYLLTVTTAVANGGIFNLVDPNGAIVATDLAITVGAGASTILEVAGLVFTVTDGATDFAAADFFTLTVAADGKLVPYVVAGDGGAQFPKTVLTFDVTATGAGDEAIRSMVSGSVRAERLIIDADGDNSNVTDAILDLLRDFSLISIDVQELNILDNQ